MAGIRDGDLHYRHAASWPGSLRRRRAATSRQKSRLRDSTAMRIDPARTAVASGRSWKGGGRFTFTWRSFAGSRRFATRTTLRATLLLRGHFKERTVGPRGGQEASWTMPALGSTRTRTLQKDFETGPIQFQRCRPSRSGRASATRRRCRRPLQSMRAFPQHNPQNRDIERAFVLGHGVPAARRRGHVPDGQLRPRAGRAGPTRRICPRPRGSWRNAREWWERFLDASAQARSPFPAREPHARDLLARCKQFAPK